MKLPGITYLGPAVDDPEILIELPGDLRAVLGDSNGFIAFGGGFHVRGACREPPWHSIRDTWSGPRSLASLYWNLQPTDIPFAEDALGDQFFLRDEIVWQLKGETGEIESTRMGVPDFMSAVVENPIECLALEPLARFLQDGGKLEPGQLLAAYPPFCTTESQNGVTMRAVPAEERIAFLGYLAAQLKDLPDGARVEFKVTK